MRVSNSLEFARALFNMNNLRVGLDRYQQQVSSGKRLASASEDPVAATQVLSIGERSATLAQFDRNANLAGLRLGDQEAALGGTVNSLQRVRELVLQGRNRAMTADDRRFLNAEIRQRLEEIIGFGNTRNASGEYVFAGSAVATRPFATTPSGAISYSGDQTPRELSVAEGRTIAEGFSGADAFMAVRNGNGTFTTALGVANTGTGRVIDDTVLDPSAYVANNFSINFTSATTFDVVNTTTGTTVLAAQPYTDGAAITFNGSSMAITGTPTPGDTFSVGPSQNQSIFTTIQKLITAMDTTATSATQTATQSFALDRGLSDIDQSLNKLDSLRASIGGRQNALDSQLQSNGELQFQLTKARSTLEDADPATAISNLARYSQTLEAAQAAFAKVQGLSLFNYLR